MCYLWFLGCLMSSAWKNPKCRIGLIIGTGTNACYLEDLDKVIYLKHTNQDKNCPNEQIFL